MTACCRSRRIQPYGRPEDLKALIDAAHARGLMVFLGRRLPIISVPRGITLAAMLRSFDPDSRTPWGAAIDYDVPEVRAFAIENALHWLRHLSLRWPASRRGPFHQQAWRRRSSRISAARWGALAIETDRTIHLSRE